MSKCNAKTEVYSRVVGFYRPVQQWNPGKKQEFKDRKAYKVPSATRWSDKLKEELETEKKAAVG